MQQKDKDMQLIIITDITEIIFYAFILKSLNYQSLQPDFYGW